MGALKKYLSVFHPDWLTRPPEARIDGATVAEYAAWRRVSCGERALAFDLRGLRDALRLISPDQDWAWLLDTVKRIAAAAPPRRFRYHLVTSDRLYQLGVELMDGALADANRARRPTKAHAFKYRDGLIIALLLMRTALPSRALTALRMGQHIVKIGNLWELDIPAADTKTRRPLDFPISQEVSQRIDMYLERFRTRIPGSDKHTGLWASNEGRPMVANGIYLTVRKRTKKALGFDVNLHRFRHAAASFQCKSRIQSM